MKFQRKCPICNTNLSYQRKGALVLAEKNNHKCRKCYYESRKVELKRFCPQCNKLIIYTTYNGLYIANHNKTLCNECRKINHIKNKENQSFHKFCECGEKMKYKEKWLLNRSIRNHSKCRKCQSKGKYHTEYTKRKISKSKLNNPNKEKSSKKMRISAIKRIENRNGICHPNYSMDACLYFDSVERMNNWNGMYATKNKEYHIKELGYFVDYYEPNLNLVIEYDESKHFNNGKLKHKDIKRMNEIKRYLHCKFLRYNEDTKELKEY